MSPRHNLSAFPSLTADRRARLRLFFCALALALILSGPAAARDEADTGGPAEQAPTRIKVDEHAEVIRFIVEGEERAVLDSDGLHVRGDVTYGGRIKDAGQEGYPGGGVEPRGKAGRDAQ